MRRQAESGPSKACRHLPWATWLQREARAARRAPDPRTCRSVPWNRWRGRVRRSPSPGRPALRNAQSSAIGQVSHSGDLAVQITAPSSITDWFHVTDGRSPRCSRERFAATDSAVHDMFGATGIIGDVSIAPENLGLWAHAGSPARVRPAGRSPARFDAQEHAAQHAANVGIDHGNRSPNAKLITAEAV